MSRLLLRNIYHLVTGARQRRLRGYDLLVKDGVVADVGQGLCVDDAEVVDCSTKLVIPGLVNAHHHMYQTLQRNVGAVQNSSLFDWLVGLYPIWSHLSAEAVNVSTQLAVAELLKTGCTTTSDHHYVFPTHVAADLMNIQVTAARKAGIRFCVTRGSMSRGVDDGGLPPQNVVETEERILAHSAEVIESYHDSSAHAHTRVALAPCSPFSVSSELMRQTARLAREHDVRLHTHLAETEDEQRYCLERYGKRPLALMEEWDWLGEDVWFAHGIHFNDEELDLLARTKTGIAHCASSNMRLGSGFCRLPEMLARGIPVALGVDGSASNDSSCMLAELRSCLYLQRVRHGAAVLSAEDVLSLATVGGAVVLGFDTVGSLEPGSAGGRCTY